MPPTAPAQKIWTILDLITWGTTYLADRGFEHARLNVELLAAHVLHLQRIQLYVKFDRPLNDEELARFKEAFTRRLRHEPIQYITGTTEFMGRPFAVNKHVLIPRPETEILAERVIEKMRAVFGTERPMRVLDLGTGSGCIAVAIACAMPQAIITAVDISPEALAVATENAAANACGERITFRQMDMRAMDTGDIGAPMDVIVSNPPYISTTEYERLEPDVRDFEPPIALADGGNGLAYYEHIAAVAERMLAPGGFIAVEHAFDQAESVASILARHGFGTIESVKDYAGIDRIAIAERT